MSTDTTTNQATQFSDNQSYKVDIETIYNEFIKKIDIIRSNVSTAKNSTQLENFINSLSATNPSTSSLISQLTIDPNNLQESRCHAFYRMLGLPSFEPGGSFYSPGLIHTNATDTSTTNLAETKINVAKNIETDLYGLMDAREFVFNQFNSIFSVSDINASVLALSSTKLRKFSVITSTDVDPFDTSVVNQRHSFPDTRNITDTADFVGTTSEPSSTASTATTVGNAVSGVSATTTDISSVPGFGGDIPAFTGGYQDSNGRSPSGSVISLLQHRSHIVKPFMVDPRVELTVNPPYVGSPGNGDNTTVCKIIGAPFPTDKSQLLYVENVYATRPIIETICRSRFSTSQPASALPERLKDIMDYVKNTDVIKDSELLDKVYQNPTKTPEDTVFLKYINIMRSMMDVLFDSLFHVITDTETKYHWVPIPDKRGPEFGSTTQGIIIGDPLNTVADIAIADKIVKSEIGQITTQTTQNNRPDLGNFIDFEKTQPQPDDQSASGFGDRNQETLESMIDDRKAQTDAANEALRKIEIIMGEFSGFGLCDIIAVYLALWTISQEDLVNMLDDGAFSRLYQDTTLRSEAVQARNGNNGEPTNNIVTTMKHFEQQVINIYAVMDKLFLDRLLNSGTSNF